MECTLPEIPLDQLERTRIEECLIRNAGNRTHAARQLGISTRTLQRKLKSWRTLDATKRRIEGSAWDLL